MTVATITLSPHLLAPRRELLVPLPGQRLEELRPHGLLPADAARHRRIGRRRVVSAAGCCSIGSYRLHLIACVPFQKRSANLGHLCAIVT